MVVVVLLLLEMVEAVVVPGVMDMTIIVEHIEVAVVQE